jgi:hypothetical protein
MNTVDALLALEAGKVIPKDTPIKVRGYQPCRLATGRPTKKRELVVLFTDSYGCRISRRFPFTMILFGEDDIKRGYAKAGAGSMTITRRHGDIEFECDSCGDTLETFTDDWLDAKETLDRNKWLARLRDDQWVHFCGQPCLDTEND